MRKIKASKDFDKVFFLMLSGCIMGFGTFLVLLLTFLTAYFSKEKGTIIMINAYGEAHLELFMLFVLFDFFIICLVYGLKNIYCRDSGKSYEYQKNLRELFFEYRAEGLRPREALEKAKRVLASFEESLPRRWQMQFKHVCKGFANHLQNVWNAYLLGIFANDLRFIYKKMPKTF